MNFLVDVMQLVATSSSILDFLIRQLGRKFFKKLVEFEVQLFARTLESWYSVLYFALMCLHHCLHILVSIEGFGQGFKNVDHSVKEGMKNLDSKQICLTYYLISVYSFSNLSISNFNHVESTIKASLTILLQKRISIFYHGNVSGHQSMICSREVRSFEILDLSFFFHT